MQHCLLLALAMFTLVPEAAFAQLTFEDEPIRYHDTSSNDRIARLIRDIESDQVTLKYDAEFGHLPALLKYLGVSPTTQALVFSKTSFQNGLISPTTPRAIYFGDDIYVGRVLNSDTLEVAALDDHLGTLFYTFQQSREKKPEIIRDRGECLICHASPKTQGVPGLLVRSVFPGHNGLPFFGSNTYTSDHTSPFHERWGGWYVTGTHGSMHHMGNALFDSRSSIESFTKLRPDQGTNMTTLEGRFDLSLHLSPHSDIVALLVLEHQTQMQNMIVRAHFDGLKTAHYQDTRNKLKGRPDNFVSESTVRRYASSAERVVRNLLFVNEFPLTDSVTGTSGFAEYFESKGIADSQGRHFRQLDLKRRLFKFPCSYMIYTTSFDGLYPEVKKVVYRRLWEVLSGEDSSEDFQHLSVEDRRAIRDILIATKADQLPVYWK